MSSLDEKIKTLALTNWEEFVNIIGADSIVVGKMRLLRQEGRSYSWISRKLQVTVSQVKYACRNLEAKNYPVKLS